MLCAGCATLKPGKDGQLEATYSGTASGASQILAEQNRRLQTLQTEATYSGTASGASQILAEQNRRLQTLQTGEVALRAIEKKMPVTLGQDASRSDVQAGWTMFGMGGMYGANMNGSSPAMMAAEAASMGYAPGLPLLSQGQYYQTSQPKGGGSGDSAIEQRLDRIERDQVIIVRDVLKKK
ncbi:MAG: hypothetical protein NTX72_00345 [Candidatus Uhrbacteria bacterium]|nr:hypothetical protein [Candidatus Uhrbacteria bacterium]